MARQALQPDGIAVPKLPYSPVVLGGDIVYTAGQGGSDANGDLVSPEIEAQARKALENLGRCLAVAGCGYEDVIKVTIFVSDWGNFAIVNNVYKEFFKPPYPARTTVQAGLLEGFLVEIEAVAYRPSDGPAT